MALLPRRKQAPAAPQTEPQGGSGRYNTQGFLDFDEINASLRGKAGLDVFEKMWRTDADCRKALTMIVSAMVGGSWTVEAPGDDANPTTAQEEEITEFVRFALFEAMDPDLPSHIWTAGEVAGRSGFAPFEQVWRRDVFNGRDVWLLDTLDLRRPRSVDKFNPDGHRLASIEQFTPGTRNGKLIGRATIEAQNLVFYRFGAEGDNWEGQSLLRPAYKHWKYKDAIERMQAMGIERSALGVPTGYVPEGASPEQIEAFEDFLSSVRASDATYFLAPGPAAQFADKGQGWHWEYVTPNSTRGDSVAIPDTLKYHSDKIAASVLEEFMRQGMGEVGTNATAVTQQNPFFDMCEALVAIVIEAPLNRSLIPRLVDLNYSTDRYPKLSCSLIDSTNLEELADYVQKLAAAGAIRPEPRLEAYLRERADFPEADEDAIAKAKEEEQQQAQAESAQAHAQALELTAAKGPPPPAPGQKQMSLDEQPRQLARQQRDLKPHEMHMQLDRIESAIDGARARFEQAAGGQTLELARQLADSARAGDRISPADPPADLVDAIAVALEGLYSTGRSTVREELASQAAAVTPAFTLAAMDRSDPAPSALERLRARASAAADAIRAAIAAALHRSALHQGTAPADLQLAAERAGSAALRAAAQDHAAAALNAGRIDQADDLSDQIAGAYYTSILDGNRCRDCASADDDVLRPLDDPVRLAHMPPNPDCDGGARCRCMEAYRFKTEAPAAV